MKSILKPLPFCVSLLLTSQNIYALPCESELRAYCSLPHPGPNCEANISDDLRKDLQRLQDMAEYTKPPQYAPEIGRYYSCILRAKLDSGKNDDDKSDVDTVTPSVPGCPKYLKKSNIQWSHVGNPQLNIWEVRNVGAKTVKFTYRESGVNSSPDTLPPGQTTQVSTQSSTVPPYVVRDFQEMMSFDRSQPKQKSLHCSLSIRPQ